MKERKEVETWVLEEETKEVEAWVREEEEIDRRLGRKRVRRGRF